MSIFSTVEAVSGGVMDGVLNAISQWSGQTSEALKDLPRLRELVSQILERVKEDHPEAKWSFGMGQDRESWQLTVYSDSPSSWDILDLVRPIATEETFEGLGLYLANVGLEEAEQEG